MDRRGYAEDMTSGLLLAAFLTPAGAAPFPPCVRRAKHGIDEPRTLQGLLSCQEKARARFKAPDEAATDALGDFQRSEVRDYLVRHPDRASTADDSKLTPEVAKQKQRSREAAHANAERLPQAERAGFEALGDKLWSQSGDGQLGVTPDMAQEIVKFLNQQQGGVSAEMSDLLGSLQKDGPKLTHGSMRRLKKAARDAKGEGLDLGIEDASTEKWLLDPATDPAADEKDPGPNVN